VLNRTEESTENLLAPTGIVDSKKILSRLIAKFFKSGDKQPSTAKNNAALKDKIFVKKKNFIFLDKIWQKIKNALIYLANMVFFLLKSLTNREKFSELTAQSKVKTNDFFTNFRSSLFGLNKKSKTLLAVIIVCFGIFIVSISYSGYSGKQESLRLEYENAVSQIEQKQNQTDAFLLYNNEDGAKKILNETEELLKNFPQNSDEQKTKYQEIKTKIEGQLERVRKVIKINDSQEVANFLNLNSNAQAQNLVYLPDLKKIYAGDSSQKSIYIVDISQNLVTPITGFAQPIASLLFPSATKEKNIYYLNNDNLAIFDATKEEIANVKIELKTSVDKIAGTNNYNNKLYLLVPSDNKIYKYDKNGSSFSAPQNWLTENVDLADSVDLTIDGNIYVLKKNGTIIKLLKGKLQDFDLETVDPAIEQATKFVMLPDQNFIYVLEPIKNRLVVFNKNGQLIKQYQSDQWKDLKDVVADEKNKTIYLLNGNSVVKFAAQHIK